DRRDGPAVAGLGYDRDRARRDALDLGLPEAWLPRLAVLEPLRLLRERFDRARLLLVAEADHGLPRALDAAHVEVDLDEAEREIDDRGAILHPGDVERAPVRFFAGLVVADQVSESLLRRRRCDRQRVAKVRVDRRDLARVEARPNRLAVAAAVNLFDDLATFLDGARVEAVALLEALEV